MYQISVPALPNVNDPPGVTVGVEVGRIPGAEVDAPSLKPVPPIVGAAVEADVAPKLNPAGFCCAAEVCVAPPTVKPVEAAVWGVDAAVPGYFNHTQNSSYISCQNLGEK